MGKNYIVPHKIFKEFMEKVFERFRENTGVNPGELNLGQLYGFRTSYDPKKPSLLHEMQKLDPSLKDLRYLYNLNLRFRNFKEISLVSTKYRVVFSKYIGHKDFDDFMDSFCGKKIDISHLDIAGTYRMFALHNEHENIVVQMRCQIDDEGTILLNLNKQNIFRSSYINDLSHRLVVYFPQDFCNGMLAIDISKPSAVIFGMIMFVNGSSESGEFVAKRVAFLKSEDKDLEIPRTERCLSSNVNDELYFLNHRDFIFKALNEGLHQTVPYREYPQFY